MPSGSQQALQFFGIISLDVPGPTPPVRGVGVVSFRDLGALIADAPYSTPAPDAQHVGEYRRVVEGTFARQTILPAPFGTVFRSREALTRWLELHYFTLIEALTFLNDRAMARVTVHYADDEPEPTSLTIDMEVIETTAAETFRVLRRHAVASLAGDVSANGPAPAARASFLVERDRWSVFADVIREEQKRLRDLRIDCTGPWPPYDFVRMQFGG